MTLVPHGGRTQTSLLERADRPGLIYRPRVVRPSPTLFRIVGDRDDEAVIPWGFWGGVFAIVVGASVIGYEGVTGLWAIWDLTGAIAAITIGLLLMRFGSRTSLREEPCAELDLAAGTLRLTSSSESAALPEVGLSELNEIVYGMTTYPVSSSPGAVRVQAYSLLVRHQSDTLLPIVEASPDKEALFGLAQFLGRVMRLPITQVGLGVKG